MVDHFVVGIAAVLWLVVGVKAVGMIRQRSPATSWLWVTFLFLALAASFFTPVIAGWAEQLLSWPTLPVDTVGRTCVMTAAFSAQSMLRELTLEPGSGATRGRVVILVAAVTGLWVCRGLVGSSGNDRLGSQADSDLWAMAYLLVFLAYLGTVLVDVCRRCLEYARSAGPTLAMSLRIIAAGCVFGLGYVAVKLTATTLVLIGPGMAPVIEATSGRLLAVLGGVLVAAGSMLPLLVDGVSAVRTWVRCYRSLRALYPLWCELIATNPDLALDPASGRLADVLRVRDLEHRLYRRVIEIRDARLALRPLLDRGCGDRVLLQGWSMARAEARVMEAALSARGTAHPAREVWTPRIPGDGTLDDEIAWWTAVSREFQPSRTHRGAESSRSVEVVRT